MTPAGVGARPVRLKNVTSTRENSASVITAFDADVTTTIQDGNRALVRRYPFARIDSSPALVDSWKNSYKNKPIIRSSLYCGSLANTYENTARRTRNIVSGLSRAHTKPPIVP